MLNQAKTQYHQTKIENADQKNLFRMIDGMFQVRPVPPLPSHDSLQQLTEKFSSYFIEKMTKLHHNLAQVPVPVMSVSISSTCHSSLAEFDDVSIEKVRKTILNAPSKSCPLNPIPTRTLTTCLNELLPLITTIINSSLRKSIFPTAFKEGRLLPHIKKVTLDCEDFVSFRPITNLAFLSKIVERIAACQSRNYLIANTTLAYREFHSTETALLRVQNDLLRAIDQKKEVVLTCRLPLTQSIIPFLSKDSENSSDLQEQSSIGLCPIFLNAPRKL